MSRYNPKEIEPKWQQVWADTKAYEASEDPSKPKRYILEYFPYPSGAAMHVGHVRNYTIGDVVSRHARMNGYNVLHPMGWDAFGLPAENYAIKTGISPQQAIAENTGKFKQQLTRMGFSYDWSREFASSDPDYYRWTQWFFLLLHKQGLAYRQESNQWWCPIDKTVLANEQVENGHCWRCGSEVEKKALPQWFFKITDYADRLAKDLDDVDWSTSIKAMQRNWIGRSEGAEIRFAIDGSDDTLTVYTTRPDTLYGVTFMVVAPEHAILQTVPAAHRQSVDNYLQKIRDKSDIERQETDREKTGVFTGLYARNPINDEKIPVWTADYVLGGYGTGAIMAVPAHDERDNAFAKAFDLPIRQVVASYETYGGSIAPRENVETLKRRTIDAIIVSPDGNYLLQTEGAQTHFVGGGIDQEDADEEAAVRREVVEETGYTNIRTVRLVAPIVAGIQYRHTKDKNQQGAGGFYEVVLEDLNQIRSEVDEGKHDLAWASKDEVAGKITWSWHVNGWQHYVAGDDPQQYSGKGILVNSSTYDFMTTEEARIKIVDDLAAKGKAEKKVNYRMRDWLISRQRYWGAPIPMVHCPKDGIVPVPEDQLPIVLPELTSFEPSGDGRSPLANVPEFINTTCPTCGGPAERETDTMDGFACSSWYFLRFADPHNSDAPFDAEKAKLWLPVDDYIGGAEHAVMHLLYARMWTKVMQDAGLVDFGEPFKALRNQGMILAPDGQKMSKSKGNTIQPDELIDSGYGADSIRIMELFIGPWNQSANWSVEGMGGSYRFLQRIWSLVQDLPSPANDQADPLPLQRVVHKAVKKVSLDLNSMGFNTAIAAMMECVNDLYNLRKTLPMKTAATSWRWGLVTLTQLLAPFAPFITEELWQQLGRSGSVHASSWPSFDERYLVEDMVTYAVQINGKLRGEVVVVSDADKQIVIEAAQTDEKVAPYLAVQEIKKIIVVPGRLVNFVV